MPNNNRKTQLRMTARQYAIRELRRGAKPSTEELVTGFREDHALLLSACAEELMTEALIRMFGDIMRSLVSLDGDEYQLPLPLGLEQIDLDGVISFIDPTETARTHRPAPIRWSDIAQATGVEIESHLAILKDQRDAVTKKHDDLNRVWRRVRPLMKRHLEMTLREALEIITRDGRGGSNSQDQARR